MTSASIARQTTAQAQDIADHALRRWTAAFDRADWSALTSLYTADAHLFGSKPTLYAGSDGVHEYFSQLAPGASVVFEPPQVAQPGDAVITLATTAKFRRAGEPRPYRMSWTLLEANGVWRIASHHASPRA